MTEANPTEQERKDAMEQEEKQGETQAQSAAAAPVLSYETTFQRAARRRRVRIAIEIAVIIAAVCAAVVLLNSGKSELTAAQDDALSPLTMIVAGGNEVAMTGSGWAQRDGWIQLQLSGGSVPGQSIESVTQEGSTVYVTLKKQGMTTMDLFLTEWRIEGDFPEPVEKVVLKGSPDVELQRSAS